MDTNPNTWKVPQEFPQKTTQNNTEHQEKIISSQKLYNITKVVPITERIKRRRLALLGHILRLDKDTPAQKALQFFMTPHKRPVGRPPLTWIKLVTQDLTNTITHHNIKTPLDPTSLQKLIVLAKDKDGWKREIVRSMKDNLWNSTSVSQSCKKNFWHPKLKRSKKM